MINIPKNARKILRTKIIPSIGAIWRGKLGNEPIFQVPKQLADDISVLKYLRFKDVSIYNLEGIINRPDGDIWLETILKAKPMRISIGHRYNVLRCYIGILLRILLNIMRFSDEDI